MIQWGALFNAKIQSIYKDRTPLPLHALISGVSSITRIRKTRSLSEGESLGGLYERLRKANNVHALHLWYVKLVTVEREGPFGSRVRLLVMGIRHMCQLVTPEPFRR